MKDQKAGILNAISKIATPKMAEVITDHIVEAGIEKVSLETLKSLDGVSDQAANRVVGALELHTTLAAIKPVVKRETKPSVTERYMTDTSEEERDNIAAQVAELRINEEGSRPLAWKKVREQLGLKLDQFHKVIRLSDGWKQAVANRINGLLADNKDWTYNGKLDVLTGIDGITIEEIKSLSIPVEGENLPENVSNNPVENMGLTE